MTLKRLDINNYLYCITYRKSIPIFLDLQENLAHSVPLRRDLLVYQCPMLLLAIHQKLEPETDCNVYNDGR